MFGFPSTDQAPARAGQVMLGRTLWSLLDEACGRIPNDTALNQWRDRRWQSVSNQALRQQAEVVALGLLDLGLQRGDRVAFALDNSIAFVQMELGCLLAGLVTVPIDLTQTIENIVYVLQHTEAKALVVANGALLRQLTPHLWETSTVQWVIVADPPKDWTDLQTRLTQSRPPLETWMDRIPAPCLSLYSSVSV
jgi:long-chain acyl-CoA synthetase